MKRLHFFMGVLVTATFAVACNNPRTADDSVEQAQDVNDTTAMVNKDDADFAVKAADVNMAEVELGKMAVERSADQRVKDFAAKMITDHQAAMDELVAIAARNSITLPPVMSEDHVKKQQDLMEITGKDFDRQYTDFMVKGHNDAVSLFEDASTDARNSDLQAYAAKVLPTLKKHQEEAKALWDVINPMDTIPTPPIIP